MSQIQCLHWQEDSGVTKADSGRAAEPISWPGKGPPHPGTGSHLSLHCPGLAGLFTEPVPVASPEDNYLAFCWVEMCWLWWAPALIQGKQQDHRARSKKGASTKQGFLLWEGGNSSNTSLHVS